MASRAVAQAVAPPTPAPASPRVLQRKCACAEHGQMCERCANDPRHEGPGSRLAPRIVHDVLREPGQRLDPATRAFMEPRFGRTFADVRIHTDARAAESAHAVNALAYTVGRNVVFADGRFAPHTPAGRRLLAHELAHVVQQGGATTAAPNAPLHVGEADDRHERDADAAARQPQPVRRSALPSVMLQRQPADPHRVCFDPASRPARLPQAGQCAAWSPSDCPTYGQWLRTFSGFTSFTARDTAPRSTRHSGQEVIGERATRPVDTTTGVGPAVAFDNERTSDRFIDHPTDRWVNTCLPTNLRETAYRLPSDCADIAVILRHVWLAAHRRTETHGPWVLGDRAGGDRRRQIGRVIDEVFTGNIGRMVSAYRNASGQTIRSFADLEPLLHPGDVLVWEHHNAGLGTPRTGGHTHTIVGITRTGNRITEIAALQGNQPISLPQAQDIRQHLGRTAPSESSLRDAPGRRIEADTLTGSDLQDRTPPRRRGAPAPQPVWTWADDHTTLVAAGPVRTGPSPRAPRSGQASALVSAWAPLIRAASRDRLQPTFEGALYETRSLVEQGETGFDNEAANLGTVAGERLWALAHDTKQVTEETHFRPLVNLEDVIRAVGNPPSANQPTLPALRRIFQSIREHFGLGARGATTLRFNRALRRGMSLVRVLVTGFDPFNGTSRPAAGTVNPSAEAALALDNTRIDDPTNRATIAVESVVLPVDFDAFRAGMVEGLVRPLLQSRGVDAVLTTSLDESIDPQDPVRLERFVVGVHQDQRLEAVAAAPGGQHGPAIIEAPTDLARIAAQTEQTATRRSAGIARPEVGTEITFRFPTLRAANDARRAAGRPARNDRDVPISDSRVLRQIVQTMRRDPNGTDIDFRLGRQSFHATVVEGPGGNFLSNEVSFRVLRLLAEQGQSNDVPSFHVHVPRATPNAADVIPQATSTRAAVRTRQRAIRFAADVRDRIVATLQRMIRAVAARVVARQRAGGSRSQSGGTP